MLIGVGIDIIEIERIKKAMENSLFAKRFFTELEKEYCERKNNQKFASYAARFAAKEAFVKSLGSGFRKGQFTDISVENNELGCPNIVLNGYYLDLVKKRNIKKIHLSLSHSKQWAVAQVILEGEQ